MTSTSLTYKVRRQRRTASDHLQKTRLCAEVVLSLLRGEDDLDAALTTLRAGLGASWNIVTCFQFMGGRQALLAAECSAVEEQPTLTLAHRIAEAASPVTRPDIVSLRAVCVTLAAQLRNSTSGEAVQSDDDTSL